LKPSTNVGEHDAIVDRELFDSVQAKLAAGAAARRVRLPRALLAGRIFDDRGNRMTPTHANKNGVRYRYYVSHALLQKQQTQVGSVPRVPAPEIQALIVNALHDHLGLIADDAPGAPADDRDLSCAMSNASSSNQTLSSFICMTPPSA